MLTCEECGCISETGKGWFGHIAENPEDDDGPAVYTYCPPCAEKALDVRPRAQSYV